jgi:hypothetical protein
MLEIGIYILVTILSLLGLFLTLLAIPGVWLIFVSVVLVASITNFQIITPNTLIILFVISLCSTFIDNLINILGVKAMGGSMWGILGAILGGIGGFFVGNLLGVVLGPLIGATIFEFLFAKKGFRRSLRAGLGTFLGFLLSVIFKTGVNIAIIAYVICRLIGN